MSFAETFAAGGIVMWPLLLFSVCAIAVTIERGLFWFRIKKQERQVVKDILQLYRANPPAVFAKLKQNINLPISRIFLEALELSARDSIRVAPPVCSCQGDRAGG
jgi:biopolymer transport protein ExbB